MKLPFALLSFVAACSGPSSPKTPQETAQGRAQPFQIGALEAYAVSDGFLTLPNDGNAFTGHTAEEVGDLLAAAGLPRDPLHFDIQALLVKAGDRVLLFDTGLRDPGFRDAGRLPASLALAGVAPSAVTDIFISHVHGDHVLGLLTDDGALAYPSATVHLTAPEWAFLQSDGEASSKQLVAAIGAQVDAFEPGAQLLPEVKAVDTRGHTPGHSSYEVGTGADKLFYIGDVAHHAVLSLQRPAWPIQFDTDPAAAEAVRQATLAKLASDGTRTFACHFPYPGLGHVVAEGDGLVWKPEPR